MAVMVQELTKFIREDSLRDLLGVSHATIWRWVRAGHFPKPVRIGQAAVAWPQEEVQEWIESKKAARTEVR